MSAADLRRTSNLRVLQRLDSQIVDLAISSTHVVLYQFSPSTSTWNKTDIEGPLFIVKRSCNPRFKLIVMNRNSQENLEVGVNGGMEMQLREPYLIFRDNSSSNNTTTTISTTAGGGGGSKDETIRGLWFHNDDERKSVHTYLENVVNSLSKIEEMERNAFVPPALLEGGNDGDAGGSAAGSTNGEKKQQTNVPEVNTNAAGAALLSTLTLNNSNSEKQQQKKNSSQKKQPAPASYSAAAAAKATTTSESNTTTSSNANALDKTSLQLALLSLIQEDRFLDLLHAQYLKVVRAHHNQQQQQKSKSNEGEK